MAEPISRRRLLQQTGLVVGCSVLAPVTSPGRPAAQPGAEESDATAPSTAPIAAEEYFAIHVVDDETGRGVPLVELATTFEQRYYTDSHGYVAFHEPGLMNRTVWFSVSSWGYRSPDGPFGTHGVKLTTTPGGAAQVRIVRENIAHRLYRETGYGIYRDMVLLGKPAPIEQPLLDGRVAGCDSVQTAVYRGKMHWFWGDTDRISFALGNFHMTGALTPPPERIDPERGINFDYFVNESSGFVRRMTRVKQSGSKPTWVDGLMVLPTRGGGDKLLGRYLLANQDLSPARMGLVLYNDRKQVFEEYGQPIADHAKTQLYPANDPFRAVVDDKEYYYFPGPYPVVRVCNRFDRATDLSAYEGYSCLEPGADYSKDDPPLNRDGNGRLVWTWRRGAEPTDPGKAKALVKAGHIKWDETPYQLQDAAGGKRITPARSSIAWNPRLRKWTMLFCEHGGASFLGEVWFAIANAPEGPWRAARKIATHAKEGRHYDFYNPVQHPGLMRSNGRYVYFEGTFVNTFSGATTPVPRYNYNQLMYRLDVSDPRLDLPPPPPGWSDAKPAT